MHPLPFRQFRKLRGYEAMNCKNCESETDNPKFCSISCSTTYNNAQRTTPSVPRKPRYCIKCNKDITFLSPAGAQYHPRTNCDDCLANICLITSTTITIGDIKAKARYQKHAQIRQMARRIYNNSGQPKECKICHYNRAYDVCHIVALNIWPSTTLLSQVNASKNLVALCKNHHWEFDHGYLSTELRGY